MKQLHVSAKPLCCNASPGLIKMIILSSRLALLQRKTLKRVTLVICIHLLLILAAKAVTITSTAAGGNWATATTWVGGLVPAATDAAVIATTGTNTVNIAAAATCSGITINSGATLVFSTFGLTVNGPWVNNGTLNAGSATITFGGANAAINAGTGTGNFNIIVPALATTSLAINANTTCAALSFGASLATDIVNIATGITLTVTGAVTIPRATVMNTLAVGAGTLIAGSIAFTNGGPGVRHQLTLSTGTVTVNGDITTDNPGASASIIFNGAGTLNAGVGILTTIIAGGTLTTYAGCTINYNGTGAQLIKDVNYLGNLSISGSGAKSWTLTAARTVAGDLSIQSTAILNTAGNFTLGISGATEVTGTLNLAGSSAKTFSGDVSIDPAGVWNETGNAAINFEANLSNNGTSFTAGSGTHSFSGSGKTLSGSAAIIIPTMAFTGNYTNTGTISATTLLTVTDATIRLTNNGRITGTTAITGTGGLIQGSTGILNVGNSITIATLDAATNPGNTVNYQHSGAQNIVAGHYFHLQISGGGSKTLSGNTVVAGTLTLASGFLVIPPTVNCTLSSGNAIAGADGSSSFVVTQVNTVTGAQGYLQVNNMAAALPYLFPVGNSTILYLPVILTPATTGSFSVCSWNGLTADGTPNGTVFTPAQKDLAVDAIWSVSQNSGTTADLTVAWPSALEGTAFSGYTNEQIGLARYDGAIWGFCAGTANHGLHTVAINTASVFGPFGVGRTGHILPLDWLSFDAQPRSGSILLNWSTSLAQNAAYFMVEHSMDSTGWQVLGKVNAVSNNSSTAYYQFSDANPAKGSNYYRLKEVDADGSSNYSKIVRVSCNEGNDHLVIYPDPVLNGLLNIQLAEAACIKLYNSNGILMMSKQLPAGTRQLDLSSMAKGIYFIRYGNACSKFVIQ